MIVSVLTPHILRSITLLFVVLAIFAFPVTLHERQGVIRNMEHTIAVWCMLVAVEIFLVQAFARILANWQINIAWYGAPMTIAGSILILIYAFVSRHTSRSEGDKSDGEKRLK